MNSYGYRAMTYWRRFRPQAYAAMPDPTEHFTILGQEIGQMVDTLADELAGPRPRGEGVLDWVGRQANALIRAEAMAMAELVYSSPPENPDDTGPDQEDPADDELTIFAEWAREADRKDREFWGQIRREREEQLDREAANLPPQR